MLKRLRAVTLALALSPLGAYSASNNVECPTLNVSQKAVLMKTWRYGEEKWGKGQGAKLSAVALQESELGLKIKGQGSYGIFQMKPTTAAYMEGRKDTKGVRKRLMNDFQYSAKQAHNYLAYWSDKGYSDSQMYQRYNGGYSGSNKSKHYAKQVKQKTKLLNSCYVYKDGALHDRNKHS